MEIFFYRYLDFISVKTFDFHTFKDGIVRHHSPLYSAVHDEENMNSNTVSTVTDIEHMGFKTVNNFNLVLCSLHNFIFHAGFRLAILEIPGSSCQEVVDGLCHIWTFLHPRLLSE